MVDKVIATLPAMVRPFIQARLPVWVEPRWANDQNEAMAFGPGSEIGWFDIGLPAQIGAAIANATDMRWLNTLLAGIDFMPLPALAARDVIITNGIGINAITIAEYVVMGMLTIAKGYREVVHAQQRHEWLSDAPAKIELAGSRALMIGYGGIGKLGQERLKAFQVEVTVVRRTPDASGRTLGPDQWRARLGDFDWVILAVPSTPDTDRMIGAAELAAMKRSAVLLNVARGSLVDQDALVEALTTRSIGAAFLDVTTPEPLPPGHPLWKLDNAHITMHLSGRSQTRMFERASERFLENLARYRAGEPLNFRVDLARGY